MFVFQRELSDNHLNHGTHLQMNFLHLVRRILCHDDRLRLTHHVIVVGNLDDRLRVKLLLLKQLEAALSILKF